MRQLIYSVLGLLFLVLCGCSGGKTGSKGGTRIITDMAGRQVEIPDSVRSVFIDRHSATLVYAFDTVMTVNVVFHYNDSEKKYLKKSFYEGKPYVIEEGSDEEIVRLKPDIILYANDLSPQKIDQANKLQAKLHIPVVLVDMRVNRYKEIFRFVGNLLHKQAKAEELAEFVHHYIDSIPAVAGEIPADKRHRVYYAEGDDGLRTDPTGSVHSVLLDSIGVKNVAEVEVLSGKGMTVVSMEQLYVWQPEIILVWSGNFDEMSSYKAVKTSPKWKLLHAVKNNKVYQVPWRPFGWIDRPPGVNRIIGYIWLAHLMYPERFPFDMVKVAKEYFHKFYHYNLSDSEAKELLNPQPKIV